MNRITTKLNYLYNLEAQINFKINNNNNNSLLTKIIVHISTSVNNLTRIVTKIRFYNVEGKTARLT